MISEFIGIKDAIVEKPLVYRVLVQLWVTFNFLKLTATCIVFCIVYFQTILQYLPLGRQSCNFLFCGLQFSSKKIDLLIDHSEFLQSNQVLLMNHVIQLLSVTS